MVCLLPSDNADKGADVARVGAVPFVECLNLRLRFFLIKLAKIRFTHVLPTDATTFSFANSVTRIENASVNHGLFPFCILVDIPRLVFNGSPDLLYSNNQRAGIFMIHQVVISPRTAAAVAAHGKD